MRENEVSADSEIGKNEDPLARKEQRYATLTILVPTFGAVVALITTYFQGLRPLDLSLLVGMYLVTGIGVEIGMHRFFSHQAFRAGPWVTAFFGITGSMAAQGPILFWAATHRCHHAFTDKDGDPHSPRRQGGGLRGFWFAHVGWMFSIRPQNLRQYVPDLMRQRLVLRIHQTYMRWVLLGLLIPTLLGACIGGTARDALGGLLWGGLLRIFLVDQATWAINSFAHTFGHRPHVTRDTSRNLWWLALPSLGGGWHNNHHAQPAYAHTGRTWWQLDPAAWFIELLAALRLVTEVKRPPQKTKTV